MKIFSVQPRWTQATLIISSALFAGCVVTSAPEHPRANSSPPRASAPRAPVVTPRPAASPPREVVVVDATPEPLPAPRVDRVIFFSEPNFRGDSFIVEVGAAVDNLVHLSRGRGSWNDAVSSFRIEGVATVVAYTDANFRGPRLETSSSLGDLVAERRGGAVEVNWDRVISSLRVVAPRSRSYEPEPEPGYDRRTAENIVRRAYLDILGREADADGLRNYRDKLTGRGWTEEDVRNQLRRSGEFHAINPDEVITKAYREVLQRDPDPAGLSHYRDLLANHGWTIPQLRADLLRSNEWTDKRIRDVITKAYRDILGRDPDPGGFDTYVRAIRDKAWDEQKIRADLQRSAEARQRNGK